MEEVCEGKDFIFPREEEKILKFWNDIDAFQTQLKRTEGLSEYVFYDGPPFATGLPHYGHILAGTIKDVVTRYFTAKGHHVTRRFGWDCHGLPVEYEIDQKLNIKTREDVLKLGIDVYNEECRSIVMRYSREWETTITRMGRWIDFKNDYKTLDPSFMESVWWVFKQLYEKGLVYRGYKVMPYSTGCQTALSNFEAGLNYKDVSDPAVMIAFPLLGEGESEGSLVAWTTTPWTLPSNLALCVNPEFTYVKAKSKETGAIYIVAKSLLGSLPGPKKKSKGESTDGTVPSKVTGGGGTVGPKGKKGGKGGKGEKGGEKVEKAPPTEAVGYEILETFLGSTLVGRKYSPLFPYFEPTFGSTSFVVMGDSYVTDKSGTGVVHCAPAFGEDDYRVCLSHGIVSKGGSLPNPVDSNGCFTDPVTDFLGRYVKDADKDIIAKVKSMGRLVNSGSIVHSYPFCWRSDSPLIYKVVPSWFVAVEQLRPQLLSCVSQTYWVPDFVKEKRFRNWLEGAQDWAVSRSRFWGTPMPIWASEDGEEIKVIGSIDELEELSGFKATDLHRHKIDHVEIPSSRGPDFPKLKRVEDVFDCWFESGSMPYAYIHYPFENVPLFEKNFPGNFVAEGLDQTRGWFYTMMVLSVALFGKPAFQNLICNGLVLAEDGKKMSKRLKNYPPPQDVVDQYGADALRLYLINSPVVRAEPLRFKKEGVFAVVRDVFLPWYNAYRFLVQNAVRLQTESPPGTPPFSPVSIQKILTTPNVLDRWILSYSWSLVRFVRQEMEAYRLYTVVPYLLKFVDRLTNVYVRLNRKRLKGKRGEGSEEGDGEGDASLALSTLFHVLLTLCKAMAPFTPFFTEAIFQNLKKALPAQQQEDSIHFCGFPEAEGESDARIEESVSRMTTVIDLGRNIREKHSKALKTPLKEMIIVHPDADFLEDITGKLKEYVLEELNVRQIVPCNDPLKFASLKAEPDFSVLGKRLGKSMAVVAKAVKALSTADILNFEKEGSILIEGHLLSKSDIKIVREFSAPKDLDPEAVLDAAGDGDVLVILDLREEESLLEAGVAREVVNRVQKLRKKAGLEPSDSVEVFFDLKSQGEGLKLVLQNQIVLAKELVQGVADAMFELTLTRATLHFDFDSLKASCQGNESHATAVSVSLLSRDWGKLKHEFSKQNGKLLVAIEGQPSNSVVLGKEVFFSASDLHYRTH